MATRIKDEEQLAISKLPSGLVAPEGESRAAGGSATGGGINFQAAITAIVFAYTLRGQRLGWLSGLHDDVPISVDAETGGGGDDIRMVMRGGKRCDIQVKRGLQRGAHLWDAMMAMSSAIAEGRVDFGILAVSASSSHTIREGLANALFRIGDGRTDKLPEIGEALLAKLDDAGLPAADVCRALRIVTLSAAAHDGSSIAAAKAELGHVCHEIDGVGPAWNALYRDAVHLIDTRGRRDASSLFRMLRAEGVELVRDTASPASLLANLAEWTVATNATFQIFGVGKPLRIDEAWIPLQAIVREEEARPTDALSALAAYQSWHEREYSRDTHTVNPETLGRFVRLGVLVAGPGMGKTTLLARVASAYAGDGIPVLKVRLAAVAARMNGGETFEEAVFALGLAESAISPAAARAAGIQDWVLLCDGLDETGSAQQLVASAAERFTVGNPRFRVIVTTRPVGYNAADFKAWRHYDIVPLERNSAERNLAKLLAEIGGEGSPLSEKAEVIAGKELEKEGTSKAVARSPLLLALGASVIARGGSLGGSRHRLYDRLFSLIDEAPNSRTPEPPAEASILRRFLDILGWRLISDPLVPVDEILRRCSSILADDLGLKPLVSLAAAESYLRYWQDVGLIERIGIRDTEVLTFLHKTFGEFAAARFLVSLPEPERVDIIAKIRSDAGWNETLGFAAMMGVAHDVCSALMDGIASDQAGIVRAARCLEIIGEAGDPPSQPLRKVVFDYSFAAMRSPRRLWAVEVGLAAMAAARRFPDEFASSCSALLSSPQSWSRLAAWACLAVAGPPHVDLDCLRQAIGREPALADGGWRPSHDGKIILGPGNERELAQAFVLAGTRLLLEHIPGRETEEAVVVACRTKDLGSIGFLSDAATLLAEFGICENLWPDRGAALGRFLSPGSDFMRAQRKAYTAIFEALAYCPTEAAPRIDAPKLLHLSAFLQGSEHMSLPISDIWGWQEAYDEGSVRETLRLAVAASGISVQALRDEAREASLRLGDPDELGRMFQWITSVDAPPIDWNAAAECDPDLGKVEAALYHSSTWIVFIAAHLLEVIPEQEVLTGIVLRAVERGYDETLWAAAGLATDLDGPLMIQAFHDRLARDPSRGCQHLLLGLTRLSAPADARLLSSIESGFFCGTLETAMAAADLSVRYASPATAEMLPILERASAYWKEHEKPYPAGGGVIPESPRCKIAQAVAAIVAPTYGDTISHIADTRSDIRDFGSKTMLALLGAEPALSAAFLDHVEAGVLPSYLLDGALQGGVGWTVDALDRVRAMLRADREEVRYAAMSVLDDRYSGADFIAKQAAAMTADTDRETKERAYRILDSLPS